MLSDLSTIITIRQGQRSSGKGNIIRTIFVGFVFCCNSICFYLRHIVYDLIDFFLVRFNNAKNSNEILFLFVKFSFIHPSVTLQQVEQDKYSYSQYKYKYPGILTQFWVDPCFPDSNIHKTWDQNLCSS